MRFNSEARLEKREILPSTTRDDPLNLIFVVVKDASGSNVFLTISQSH